MEEQKRYPAGSAEGRRLFQTLLDMAARARYDDDFLAALVAYREMYPQSEKFAIFFARYALYHGNTEVALEYAREAEKLRPLNYMVWQLLAEVLRARGEAEEALLYAGLGAEFYQAPMNAAIERERLEASLAMLSKTVGVGNYAPFMTKWMVMTEAGLEARCHVVVGDFLPIRYGEKPVWWVGAYAEQEHLGAKGWLASQHVEDEGFVRRGGADFIFDIHRAEVVEGRLTVEASEPVLLPLLGSTQQQTVHFRAAGVDDSAWLGQWETSFFRVEGRTEITSSAPFVQGTPVVVGHSPKRRRVVLNILLDGLCWKEMIRENFRYVPNLVKFFSKGIIFNDHFSVSEYTLPSLATIKTGRYPHHSQIFNRYMATVLSPAYATISEEMRALGYYCVSLMGDGSEIYSGCDGGFDRMLVNSYALPTYVGVERAIRQMEAFGEVDHTLSSIRRIPTLGRRRIIRWRWLHRRSFPWRIAWRGARPAFPASIFPTRPFIPARINRGSRRRIAALASSSIILRHIIVRRSTSCRSFRIMGCRSTMKRRIF